MINFTQLRYFCEIAKHLSINSAANACCISYNAMYKSLKNLEKDLGIALVNCDHTGTTLTKEGEEFYLDCQKILEISNKWQQDLNPNTQNNVIKIYATHFFINNLICQNITDILKKRNILVSYIACPYPMFEKMLPNCVNEQLIFLAQYNPQKYDSKHLCKEYHYKISYLCSDDCKVYMSKKNAPENKISFSLEELQKYTFITFTHGLNSWLSFDMSSFFEQCATLVVNSHENIFPLLSESNTFSILRSSLYNSLDEKYKETILTFPIDDLFTGTDYYAVYPPNIGEAGKTTLNQLKKYCQKHYCTEKYFF